MVAGMNADIKIIKTAAETGLTHAFSEALASPEAHAAFRAFLSAGRK